MATRDPATLTRTAIEGSGLTGVAVVVAYFIGLIFPDMPVAMQLVLVGVIVTKGNLLLSHFRNRRYDGKSLLGVTLLGVGLALFVGSGCSHLDAAGYHRLAQAEIEALNETPAQITAERCEAHRAAAAALRDKDGKDSAWGGPLGSKSAIENEALIHERQAYVCDRLVDLNNSGALSAGLAERTRMAWLKIYESCNRLLGGK